MMVPLPQLEWTKTFKAAGSDTHVTFQCARPVIFEGDPSGEAAPFGLDQITSAMLS
jgi:hypothetical protein